VPSSFIGVSPSRTKIRWPPKCRNRSIHSDSLGTVISSPFWLLVLVVFASARPMLGFKSFQNAVVICGIELAEKIKKQQFKIGQLGGHGSTMSEN
jgi:hypothetical protein